MSTDRMKCVRCGVPLTTSSGRPGRCEDCKSLGWRENDYWIRRNLTTTYRSTCECGRSTWEKCDDCRRVGVHLNNRRLQRRRAAA